MKKSILGLALIALLVTLPLSFALAKGKGENTRVLSAVGLLPVDNVNMAHMWKYAEWVKEASDGKLIIDVKGNGEVIPTEEQIFALSKGRIDMIFTMGDDISQMSPLGSGMILTGMTPWEERKRGIWDFYRKIYARDCNAYWLGHLYTAQFFTLNSNVPAKSPKDLKGMKIRSGITHLNSVKAVGAVPVSTPMMDIYTAMERGTIDAFFMVPVGFTQWGWHEVTKYWVGPPLFEGSSPSCPLINLDLWKSLSEQEKKWLTQPLLDHEEDIYAYHFWIYRGAKYGIEATLNAGVKRIEWSEEDNESFKETWYEALWDYIEENMKSQDFDRFEKLVGHK